METLRQIIAPDFLLRNSVYTSVLIGFACPLVGVFLVLRRLVFMGVALPQISSTGVATALSVPLWLGLIRPEHAAHSEHLLAYIGSTFFSLAAILFMGFLERRGRGSPEGRLGTGYVVAAALSIILLSKNRYGEVGWLDLMKGEVITIDNVDLVMTGSILALVLATLGLFHKEILLVSFDRAMAVTLGKNIVFWDLLLYMLIGLTVSMAVLSVGPLISFGFLLIPALTAHLFARTMRQFTMLASVFGGLCAFVGFWIAYQFDLPVGPTDVVLLGVAYGLAFLIQRGIGLLKLKPVKAEMIVIAAGLLLISPVLAGETTLQGKGVCAKCDLGETNKCQPTLEVTKGSKTEIYYVEGTAAKDLHRFICDGPKDGVILTGTVKEKDGKKWIAGKLLAPHE
jgi:ABC-type Mn2+/Zn2+ transport system permease subunit